MSRNTALPASSFPPARAPHVPNLPVVIEVHLWSATKARTTFEWNFAGIAPQSMTFLLAEASQNGEVTAFTYARARDEDRFFTFPGDQRGADIGFALAVADPNFLQDWAANPRNTPWYEPALLLGHLDPLLIYGFVSLQPVSARWR